MKKRIELCREKGQSPTDIACYVHNTCGTSWSRKILWTLPEREELERLDREAARRKAEEAKKAADAAEVAAREAAARRALLPPRPSNLKRKGLSPTAVRDTLCCSVTELNRWAEDGRLPPDGVRFYYGVGPLGGSKWGRAWLPETVQNARPFINTWCAQDSQNEQRWISEAALFDLVRSRFPDARRQWSPHWLEGLRVDIYVPSINVAFEYQGVQHFRPVAFFGGEEGFQNRQDRDARKRELLARHGVILVEWWFDTPIIATELDRALKLVEGGDGSQLPVALGPGYFARREIPG